MLDKIKSVRYYPNPEMIIVSLFIVLIISIIFYLETSFATGFAKTATSDALIYFKMSYNPFQSTDAPFMYRILTPFLVYILPFNHITGFILVNLTALFSTAMLLYYYLKKLNFNRIHRFIGILFFLLAPTVIYSIYDISLVDFLSFFFFLLAFYAILCKNDKLYAISLILGVLNKETILFTIPLYFLYKRENEKTIEALKSTVLISLLPLILFIGIRYYFGFTGYFSLFTIEQTISYHLHSGNLLTNPYLAFGTLWIISLYNIKFIKNEFLKKTLYILPLIFLQVLIATDISRALFIAFPIIIPISLYLFKIKNIIIISLFMILSFSMVLIYSLLINSTDSNLIILVVLPLETVILITLLFVFFNNRLLKKKTIQNKSHHSSLES